MRDILFRGKDKDTGKWYEGAYRQYEDTTYCFKEDYDRHPENVHHTIIFSQMTDWGLPNRHLQAGSIIPETVGQYTGLQDKNGKRVFEGDICRVTYLDKQCSPNGEHYEGEYELIEKVVFKNGAFCFEADFEGIAMYRPIGFEIYEKQRIKRFEILGNIFDNPELLEDVNK
ncbi:MAG: YopX family protein [Roseburia sp.]|nr:YopX family protein [Roseburia sp.]